jgi:hypothetical protein
MILGVNELIDLVQAIAWPIVAIMVVIIFRRELPKLVEAISGRISSVSAVGVTLAFIANEPATETLRALNEIREPSSTGPPPPSGVPSLLELSKASHPADYLLIDLRDGHAWLTSRLYLFARILPTILGLRSFAFVGTRGMVPRYFLGLTSPDVIVLSLERRYPWLRQVMVETQLQPLIGGEDPNRYLMWRPYGDAEKAFKRLIELPDLSDWDVPQAEALSEIVRALVNPIDPSVPGQVETFVNRFLQNPNIRRPHTAGLLDADWVQLGATDEHARWIKDERDLLDLIGDDLHRQTIIDDSMTDNQLFEKAVLGKRGNFVAIIDSEGRFSRLIDRTALLERVADGTHV